MKAVVLAAGKGVRMLPLTEHIPKVLVEVNGKPFLWFVLQQLQKAGFTEIGIVAGYKKEKIHAFLEGYEITATVIEQMEQLGTGHAVLQAEQFCGKDSFVVVGGDNLFSVEDLRHIQQWDAFTYVMGKRVDHPEKYGVLVVDEGRLVRIVEKPAEFVGEVVNVGLYKFTSEIWEVLRSISLSPRGEYELTDALTILALEGKVKVLPLEGFWLDLGSRGDIPKVEEGLRKNGLTSA